MMLPARHNPKTFFLFFVSVVIFSSRSSLFLQIQCKKRDFFMDYGKMLDQTFAYTKESVWGQPKRWLLLIGCMIVFPLFLGYMVRIYRGVIPAPEPEQWGSMFLDGLKLLLIEGLYAAPVILLIILAFIPLLSALITGGALHTNPSTLTDAQIQQWVLVHPEFISSIGLMVILLLLAVLFGIIISVFSFIGVVRFARMGRMAEAFNFSAIVLQIRRIGWLNYILALIVISFIGCIFGMITNIFSIIPVVGDSLGLIVMIILYVPYLIFTSRYAALVYEAGEAEPTREPVVYTTAIITQ
jgi:hypothetical protein